VSALSYIVVAAVAAANASDPGQPVHDPTEIVVTGERISRSVRETPSSVAVFTADMIDTQPGAERLDQLLDQIPNIQKGPEGQGPSIRGQNTTGVLQDLPGFLGGTRPRVTLQVDGRAVGYNEFIFGTAPLWDVERVEVFRSAQSTTQGRNAIAGAIFVETKDPSYAWEARGRAIVENFDGRQVSLAASGPLVDHQLAFRVATDIRRSRTATEYSGRLIGADPNRERYGFVRFKLLAEPAALRGSRIELNVTHLNSKMPGTENFVAPFKKRRGPDTVPVFAVRADSLTGRLNLDLAEFLTMATTMSGGDSYARRFVSPGLGESRSWIDDFSIETVVAWSPDGPIRLHGGIHHWRQNLRQSIDLTAIVGLGEFRDRQQSFGLFGEATVEPLPRLSVTTGLRYQRDDQDRQGSLGVGSVPAIIDFNESFAAWLPKLTAAYELTNMIKAGFLVQRAYNPGGTTINFDSLRQDDFAPETLWSYEIFVRGSLFDGKFDASANLFFNDFRKAQRATTRARFLPGGLPLFWADIDNVPRARAYGLEASIDWRATDRLRLRAGLGLLQTRLLETTNPANPINGKQFQRSPKITGSALVDWRPIPRLRLDASVRHHSRYYSDDANISAFRIGAATIVDAKAAFDFGPATLSAYARNLLNDFNMTHIFNPTTGTASNPREVGFGLEAQF
jgi:iron complex outermembrane recepter protein